MRVSISYFASPARKRHRQAWRQLRWGDRRLLLQVCLLLPFTAVMLRLVGFARCQTVVSRIARTIATADSGARHLDRARATARLVRIAAEHGVYRATCLPQSLVLWWLLKRQGMDAALRVGVRKAADRVEAHAWVECGGVVLLDDADVHERYAAFDRAIVQ